MSNILEFSFLEAKNIYKDFCQDVYEEGEQAKICALPVKYSDSHLSTNVSPSGNVHIYKMTCTGIFIISK